MDFFAAVRAIHIGCGAVALVAAFIPIFTRKGGPLHRRAGWCFVGAITVVAATSLLMAVHRLHDGSAPAGVDPIFLGYLSFLALNSAHTGLRALRYKYRTAPSRHPLDLLPPTAVMLGGVGLFWRGIAIGSDLELAFGALGVVVPLMHLRYWLTAPKTALDWKYQHMRSMIGAAVAVLTAFVVLNARWLDLPARFHLWIWLTPPAIGLSAVQIWIRRLQKRERSAAAD